MARWLVLNFKVYPEAIGAAGLKLAEIANDVAVKARKQIAIAPNLADLRNLAAMSRIPVFAQHCDANKPGAFTGSVTAEMLKGAGARGSLLNHSEKKMRHEDVREAIGRLRENGLISLVCADSVEEAVALAKFRPDLIAIEPPELIGSGISVSTAKPEIVSGAVEAVRKVANIPVLCGAGISSGEDVRKAVELGAEGVLLASAYVKAKDPRSLLMEMADAL